MYMLGLSTKMATSIVRVLAAYPKTRERAGKTTDAAFTTICATSPQIKRETIYVKFFYIKLKIFR